MKSLATKIIAIEEGFRSRPYYCSEHFPTIGYGFKIGDKNAPLPNFELPQPVAVAWLDYKIEKIYEQIDFTLLLDSKIREAAIASVAYQLGPRGCMLFKNMWSAIRARDWAKAHDEMLNSRWARQTPARAKRHAEMMFTNALSSYYLRDIPK